MMGVRFKLERISFFQKGSWDEKDERTYDGMRAPLCPDDPTHCVFY